MDVYDFVCTSIDGKVVSLSRYRGQVLLIVNTASKCGFTPQYRGLDALFNDYRSAGFTVLGFPCGQFFRQEYQSDSEIENFCVANYHVSFPLFSKVDVIGKSAHPLFDYLKGNAPGWFGSKAIKWNFTKFLVDRSGRSVRRFAPPTYPGKLRRPIEKLLAQTEGEVGFD